MTESAKVPLGLFTEWLASGERGISSEAIVSQLTGAQVGRYNHDSGHPSDPSDFRRCELLLRRYSLIRSAFMAEMPARSSVWAALVAQWDTIVAVAEAEVPGCFDAAEPRGNAPKTYALMKSLISSAQVSA